MSKRRHDTAGAFDALVQAIVGLGAIPGWTGLPPATAPNTLGRALGQGVVHGRIPRVPQGALAAEASPLPAPQMQHEGQRSIAELGAILWHAMGGPHDAPELEPWMAPPHTDPIVALALSRRQLDEYARPEPIDRTWAFPGGRVWLVEIERAKGDVPGGIAVWRSPSAGGAWKTRCACVWTHGPFASTTHPLVIGAQWDAEGTEAVAGACVIGPSWEHAARASKGASRGAVLARRRDTIGSQMMARIVVPAAAAWLDRHAGTARPAGRFGATDAGTPNGHAPPGLPARTVRPVPAAPRTPAPAWLTAGAARAVEAIVLGAAREGWRIGASCPVPAWRSGWAGYAEMGAVAWHAIGDPHARIDSETWSALEKTLREDHVAARGAYPALEATGALVRKMLEQTGRDHVARAPDARTLCALETPARLWRALGEAGPCPQPPAALELSERWWLVEVESPADEEPNAVALWEADGAEVVLAAFLCDDDSAAASFLSVITWRTTPDGERSRPGVATLTCPPHVDDPDNAESRAGMQHVIDTLAAPDTGSIARVKTAIALHLASDGRAAPLASYRPATPGGRKEGGGGAARRHSIMTLFALERAPEPEPAQERSTAERDHRGGGGRLTARHHVRAHWKRQAFGPRLSRRRWIVVEGYARGPAPGDDQIVVTRLAEGGLGAGDGTTRP